MTLSFVKPVVSGQLNTGMCLVNFCSDVSERQVPTLPVFKENVCCLLRVVKLVLIMPFLQVIIFVKTVYRCVALAGLLVEQNFPAICIHRDMKQEERLVTLDCCKKIVTHFQTFHKENRLLDALFLVLFFIRTFQPIFFSCPGCFLLFSGCLVTRSLKISPRECWLPPTCLAVEWT